MDTEVPSEPLFRANKRRKVLRKRADSDADVEVGSLPTVVIGTDADATITEPPPVDATKAAGAPLWLQKRGGTRKHGIGFSSAETRSRSVNDEQQNEVTALVPAKEDGALEVAAQNERFVKPTGRVDVTEDRHMTAYIDSKMAEMRSVTPTTDGHVTLSPATRVEDEEPHPDFITASEQQIAISASDLRTKTFQEAQARSTRKYQRPTKRRQAPVRDQSHVARDSLIDQILNESQVPIYDQSASKATISAGDNKDDVDNDAAAAEAFKAQLLADLEQNRKRMRTATASTGPKLGGSRSQREKMRALEEAAGKGGAAGKK